MVVTVSIYLRISKDYIIAEEETIADLRGAVFDFDHTIINEVAGILLAERIEEEYGVDRWRRFWEMQKLFRSDRYEVAVSRLSDEYATALKGLLESDVQRIAQHLSATLTDGFAETYKLLKRNGYSIYVISASPCIAITNILRGQFEMDGIFGLEFRVRDGAFTGRHKGAIVPTRKGSIITEMIKTSHQEIIAFTDNPSDANLPGVDATHLIQGSFQDFLSRNKQHRHVHRYSG